MSVRRYLQAAFTLAEFELRKIRHDTSQIWLRLVQPVLWLLIFGTVFGKVREISSGPYTYRQFMTPGILAQSVMFVAIFYGITVVWERDLGLLNRLLSTPVPRSAIVLGKALSAGVRGIFQAFAVLVIALIIHVQLTLTVWSVLGVFLIIVLFGMCFSSLSMSLAPIFRTRERMMGIGQAITMPLFFASNAIYPLALMPRWLKAIALVNPLSYVVDAMRTLLVTGDFSSLGKDALAIFIATAAMITLASLAFRKILS